MEDYPVCPSPDTGLSNAPDEAGPAFGAREWKEPKAELQRPMLNVQHEWKISH